MEKLCLVFVLALAVNLAVGMILRQKRQSDNNGEDLEDRYGWDRPANRPNWNQNPGQGLIFGPGQNQFPGQGQFFGQGQFPGQNRFPGQDQFFGQGQFPGQNQFPGQGRPVRPGQNQFPGQGQQTSSTTPASPGTTTQSSAFRACIQACPTTAEYNPVCGSNNETYNNPGGLACAQDCGAQVTLLRSSRCPAAS